MDEQLYRKAKDAVAQPMPCDGVSQILGVTALCLGAAAAAKTQAALTPSAKLFAGTFCLVSCARFFCSTETGEYTMVRAFTVGFVAAGIFSHCLM